MNQNKLKSELSRLGVHPSSYSLGLKHNNECVSVVYEDGNWKVFYTERDKAEELASFSTEETAYDFIYATFCKWVGKFPEDEAVL